MNYIPKKKNYFSLNSLLFIMSKTTFLFLFIHTNDSYLVYIHTISLILTIDYVSVVFIYQAYDIWWSLMGGPWCSSATRFNLDYFPDFLFVNIIIIITVLELAQQSRKKTDDQSSTHLPLVLIQFANPFYWINSFIFMQTLLLSIILIFWYLQFNTSFFRISHLSSLSVSHSLCSKNSFVCAPVSI